MRQGYEIFWYLMSRLSLALAAALLPPLALSPRDALAVGSGVRGVLAFAGKGEAVAAQGEGLILFGVPLLVALGSGALFYWLGRAHRRPLRLGEGACFAVLAWLYLAAVGALPFLLSGRLAPLAAFFESMAAFTATGLSCFPAAATLPPSLLLWHGLMSWLGGLTFVVMLVTVLPQVSGCFGITLTARQSVAFSPVWWRMHLALWRGLFVYGGLTALFFAVLALLGLTPFEALLLAMLTISTAGSSLTAAFQPYDSPALEVAGCLMMLVTGGNFLLYWKAISRRSLGLLVRDAELRAALVIATASGLLIGAHLFLTQTYAAGEALRHGLFQAVSFFTTAGFSSTAVAGWPDFDRYLLFLLAFTGACLGSPAGGLKTVRLLVLGRMTAEELRRTLHPHMVVCVRLDGLPVPDKVVGRLLALFFLTVVVLFSGTLAVAASGVPVLSALGLAAGCLTSTGHTAALFGFTDLAVLSALGKSVCIGLMLLGRVEIFSALLFACFVGERLRRRW